jgi:hypothetical protein
MGMKPSRPTSAAGADCLYGCDGPICHDLSNHADFCQEIRAKCEARCSGKRWWGAVAYSSKENAFGYSYDFQTSAAAQTEALRRCAADGGKDCKVWAYYENECGAIARDGNIVTWEGRG